MRITEFGARLRFTLILGYEHAVTSHAAIPQIYALKGVREALAGLAGGFTETVGSGGWIEGAETGGTRGALKVETARTFTVSVDATHTPAAWTHMIRTAVAPHAQALGVTWAHLECEEVQAHHFNVNAFVPAAAE